MLLLVLMRHGEAAEALDDRSRPLTERGARQALASVELLKGWGVIPSLIMTSDAQRAKSTTQVVVSSLGAEPRVEVSRRLYDGYTTQGLLDEVRANVGASDDCVMVVAHNPDLTYKLHNLCRCACIASFPTAGVVVLCFDAENWDEVEARSASVLFSSFF